MKEILGLLGNVQSPSFQAVAAMAQQTGTGMVMDRFQEVRYPTEMLQVWEWVPKTAPLDRAPLVVAVFLRQQAIVTWAPVPEAVAGYSAVVAHYLRRADAAWEKATAEGMDAEHLERAA